MKEGQMRVTDVVAALRFRWWLCVAGLVLGGLVALTTSLLATPRYTSHMQIFVSTTQDSSTADVLQGSQFAQQRVSSYAHLLMGEDLAGRVIEQLGLNTTPQALTSEISASVVPETVLLDVVVTDSSPQRAQQIATAVGDQFALLVTELETRSEAGGSPVKVSVVDAPEVATSATSPKTARNTLLGMFAGLLGSAGIAVVRARLDRSVITADQAAQMAGAPVIGVIERDDWLATQHTIDWCTGLAALRITGSSGPICSSSTSTTLRP